MGGVAAQKAQQFYNQCNVYWEPSETAPFTEGEGETIDITSNQRDTYPSSPLTDGTDGSYSEDGSSSVKITETFTGDLTSQDGTYTAPLTDGTDSLYSEDGSSSVKISEVFSGALSSLAGSGTYTDD